MTETSRAKQTAEVALRAVLAFGADRCSISAAGITYFALISLFPLALVALSVAGFVLSDAEARQDFIDEVIAELPLDEESGRDDLATIIESVANARGALGIFGILGALYSGSALFTAVRLGLNGVFKGEKSRNFFVGKAVDISLVLFFGLLLTLSLAASFAITFVVRFVDRVVPEDLEFTTRLALTISYFIIPPLISALTFLVLYARVPAMPVPWRSALPGALVATLAFELLKTAFAWYVASFGNYDATYGSLGFVVILLLFINLTAQVMLLGAEVARATHETRTGWPFPPGESKYAAVSEKLAKVRAKLLRREPPASAASTAGQGVSAEPVPTAPAAPVDTRPPLPRREAAPAVPAMGWALAGLAILGVYAVALVTGRRH